jgi:hypothetical protein
MLTANEILEQSKNAYGQWKELWDSNSKKNGEIFKKNGTSFKDYFFAGAGRQLVIIAVGNSFQSQIEVLKKYCKEDKFDVMCIDKTFGNCIDNGIKPKYCVSADSRIDYKQYLEPWVEHSKDVIYVQNITGNVEWSEKWLGEKVFYVNKDNIQTEKIHTKNSGCCDIIPASSSTGNTAIVFATQVLGYDKYILVGYDHCWKDNENFYGFFDSDKRYWMKSGTVINSSGEIVNTTSNLVFTFRWLNDFLVNIAQKLGVNIVNCSTSGLLTCPTRSLERELQKCEIRKLDQTEKNFIAEKLISNVRVDAANGGMEKLMQIAKDENVAYVDMRIIPKHRIDWLNSL